MWTRTIEDKPELAGECSIVVSDEVDGSRLVTGKLLMEIEYVNEIHVLWMRYRYLP